LYEYDLSAPMRSAIHSLPSSNSLSLDIDFKNLAKSLGYLK
jgi:hypothetical protein